MLFSVVSNFAETLFWFCEKLRHSRHTAVETIIYYSTYYLEKKEKKWAGQPYKFPSHAHLLILWCPLLKEKKKISALRSYSHRLFQSSASQHKNKQTKTTMLRKRKKTVFKTAIVIAVKKIMKIRKIDWNLLTRKNKNKQNKNKKKQNKQPVFHHFFPLHQIWPWWWTQAKKLLSLLQI